MKNITTIFGMAIFVILIASCQSKEDQSEDNQSEMEVDSIQIQTGGMILGGKYGGKEFAIARGNEIDIMMDIIKSYNEMDAEKIWKYSADSVAVLSFDGTKTKLTKEDMTGYFSSLDSVTWVVDAMVPVEIVNEDVVKIIVLTREKAYMKNGDVMKIRLVEEFTFIDEVMAEVRQWTADLNEEIESTPSYGDPGGAMIFTGEYEGKEMVISSGNEMDQMMKIIDDFNDMDASSLWENSEDTVIMYAENGKVIKLTEDYMQGFFDSADSIDWAVSKIIPLEIKGTNVKKVIVDSHETMNLKEGDQSKIRLFEVFTFKDGKLVAVSQWTGEFEKDM
ncbi:hypothetical protein OO013_16695 [Mangrovivirga sp. M17]|uniref:SnoaL-like domain-containing protein n=1 Tax=Mangrovivirga halotolerans TaxID=2993936 RepID=A0ABT3RVG3_9BACT|nr:hypothetical protein [Mangrovivirga halotolerans]MCX2745521.1 hypothetical protein [Mangrovivirga halotolerans]